MEEKVENSRFRVHTCTENRSELQTFTQHRILNLNFVYATSYETYIYAVVLSQSTVSQSVCAFKSVRVELFRGIKNKFKSYESSLI